MASQGVCTCDLDGPVLDPLRIHHANGILHFSVTTDDTPSYILLFLITGNVSTWPASGSAGAKGAQRERDGFAPGNGSEAGEARRILEGVEVTAQGSVARMLAETAESLAKTAREFEGSRPTSGSHSRRLRPTSRRPRSATPQRGFPPVRLQAYCMAFTSTYCLLYTADTDASYGGNTAARGPVLSMPMKGGRNDATTSGHGLGPRTRCGTHKGGHRGVPSRQA
jgi:hypothetical protein